MSRRMYPQIGFKERFRFAFDKTGMTLAGFARRLGVERKTIQAYYNGISEPPVSVLNEISSMTGVSVDWMINGGRVNVEMPERNICQQIEDVCGIICDDMCKYKDTCDENCECDYIREHGDCPLFRLY